MSTNLNYDPTKPKEPTLAQKVETGIKDLYRDVTGIFNPKDDLMKLYKNRNFEELSKKDLAQPVDDEGNTIIHIMAYNLDKDGFVQLTKYYKESHNGKVLPYDLINKENYLKEVPINKASQRVEENLSGKLGESKYRINEKASALVDYMVGTLRAVNLPNPKGIIFQEKDVEKKSPSRSESADLESKKQLEKLNERVKADLEKLSGSKTQNLACQTRQTKTNPLEEDENKLQFIRELEKEHKEPTTSQTGGYNGTRTIKNYVSDFLTETNDSFVTGKKNSMLNRNDRKNTSTRNSWERTSEILGEEIGTSDLDELDESTTSMSETSELDEPTTNISETSDIGIDEFVGGQNRKTRKNNGITRNKRTSDRKRENARQLDKPKTQSKSSGRKKSNQEPNGSSKNKDVGRSNYVKSFTEHWETDEFKFSPSSSDNRQKIQKQQKQNRRSARDDEDDEDVTGLSSINFEEETDIIDDEDSPMDVQSRPKREPQPHDEVYRSFIQKIKDAMGVDEDTARLYRSALKIIITRDRPELRGRENDALKVQAMEEIINDKEVLKKTLNRDVIPRLDEIKRIMEENREAGEKRRKEWEERKKNRGDRENRTETNTGKSTATTNTSRKQQVSSKSTSDEPATKTRKPRKSSKVAENGYIQSDEILLSPEERY